ncbi:DsbA family protein [Paracoccus sp. ME4]|uniref:DsbA family protein n=1 Tax=Paracoccus sp. ME4 TaxID=3138066 RepID=UPI00398BA3AE
MMKTMMACTAIALGLATMPAAAQDEEFGAKVRDYLMANPAVVVEALQAYDAQEKQAAYDRSLAAVNEVRDAIASDPDSPRLGAIGAEATVIVEFADYRCPHCRRANEAMRSVLADRPDVQLIVREFPVLGEQSVLAAQLALGVNALHGPDAYRELHDQLFDIGGQVDAAWIRDYAGVKGWNLAELEESMKSDAVLAEISQTEALARAIGIQGTPYFIIGDTLAPGALTPEQILGVLDAEAAGK